VLAEAQVAVVALVEQIQPTLPDQQGLTLLVVQGKYWYTSNDRSNKQKL
jgi:hypothetical protein